MHMEEIQVSENLAKQLRDRDDVELLSGPFDIPFGPDGYIIED